MRRVKYNSLLRIELSKKGLTLTGDEQSEMMNKAKSVLEKAVEVQEKLVKINLNERGKLVFLYFQNNQIEEGRKLFSVLEKANQLTPNLIEFKKRFFKKVVKTKMTSSENLED